MTNQMMSWCALRGVTDAAVQAALSVAGCTIATVSPGSQGPTAASCNIMPLPVGNVLNRDEADPLDDLPTPTANDKRENSPLLSRGFGGDNAAVRASSKAQASTSGTSSDQQRLSWLALSKRECARYKLLGFIAVRCSTASVDGLIPAG